MIDEKIDDPEWNYLGGGYKYTFWFLAEEDLIAFVNHFGYKFSYSGMVVSDAWKLGRYKRIPTNHDNQDDGVLQLLMHFESSSIEPRPFTRWDYYMCDSYKEQQENIILENMITEYVAGLNQEDVVDFARFVDDKDWMSISSVCRFELMKEYKLNK